MKKIYLTAIGLLVCLAVLFILIRRHNFFRGPSREQIDLLQKAPERTDETVVSGLGPREILDAVMSNLSETSEDWTWSSDHYSQVSEPFVRSISIKQKAINKDGRSAIFLIEEAEEEPSAAYPENNSYKCYVLALSAQENKNWLVKEFDLAVESAYEGDTRFAKNCSGFSFAWDKNNVVFSRAFKSGPYECGVFSVGTQLIKYENAAYRSSLINANESRSQ